jgi:hypothetical protein
VSLPWKAITDHNQKLYCARTQSLLGCLPNSACPVPVALVCPVSAFAASSKSTCHAKDDCAAVSPARCRAEIAFWKLENDYGSIGRPVGSPVAGIAFENDEGDLVALQVDIELPHINLLTDLEVSGGVAKYSSGKSVGPSGLRPCRSARPARDSSCGGHVLLTHSPSAPTISFPPTRLPSASPAPHAGAWIETEPVVGKEATLVCQRRAN